MKRRTIIGIIFIVVALLFETVNIAIENEKLIVR